MICNVDFRRCAVLLQEGDTVCELALDEGTLRHGGRTAPLCEIELEYVAGGEQAFHGLAAELAGQLDLVPEPESKLARAGDCNRAISGCRKGGLFLPLLT